MKPFDPEDPKWTAYLLGELSPEERDVLESELAHDPEARAFVESLRGISTALTDEFIDEPELALTERQKGQIHARIPQQKNVPLVTWVLPIAALLVLAVTLPTLFPGQVLFDVSDSGKRDDLKSTETSTLPLEPTDGASVPPIGDLPVIGSLFDYTTPSQDYGISHEHPSSQESLVLAERVSGSEQKWVVLDAARKVNIRHGQADHSFISPSQDEFDVIVANRFQRVMDYPLSTFSIDVDTASYAVVRKLLKEGRLPPKDAVRIEEMVNYFDYDYAPPLDGSAFAAHLAVSVCPWAPEHQLVRIALKGKEIPQSERPPLNLVYLLDVSGSMNSQNKLPLVKRSLRILAQQLEARDRVSIVVYAGAAGLVLPTTEGSDRKTIVAALDRLSAGGSTAGGAGIALAYKQARAQFVEGGVNRVILCTDGDFNVGTVQTGDLKELIATEAESGVQLSVLGFGMGNYKDDTLETLSNRGNGNYAYIDDFQEARKVLVDQMLGTLVTIAKDVKIQVEFNPAKVGAYRLIGYENRMLKKEDFNNDKVDAGDIGAGHTVTALYELVPPGRVVPGGAPAVDPLKYGSKPQTQESDTTELLTVKLRHKKPHGDTSTKAEYPLDDASAKGSDTDFLFATSVAAFGQWLREPAFRKTMPLDDILEIAEKGKGQDAHGCRSEFIRLVRAARDVGE